MMVPPSGQMYFPGELVTFSQGDILVYYLVFDWHEKHCTYTGIDLIAPTYETLLGMEQVITRRLNGYLDVHVVARPNNV